jgi:hypothetical protein
MITKVRSCYDNKNGVSMLPLVTKIKKMRGYTIGHAMHIKAKNIEKWASW